MAVDYGLLTQGQPAVIPQSSAAGLLAGMQTGTQMGLQQAQTQTAQLQNNLQKMQTTNSLFGAVALAPPDQQPQLYANNLKLAQKYNLDTSGLPSQWGADAQAAVNAGYYNSGLMMQQMKMQIELGMMQSLLNYRGAVAQKNISDTQKNSFDTGGYTDNPYPTAAQQTTGTTTGGSYFNPTITPNSIPQTVSQQTNGVAPGQSGYGSPITNGIAPQQAANVAPGQQGYGQQLVNQNTTASIPPSGIPPKAELEKQTAQGTDFQDWLNTAANSDKNYLQTKQAIDTLRPLINKQTGINNILPGITGNIELAMRDPDAKIMEQAGHNLNVQYIGNTAASMKGAKMDLPIVRAIQVQAISPTNRQESNIYELNRNQTANELNHALSQYAPVVNAAGIRDPNIAQTTFTNAILKSGGISKDGKFDQGKFETWPQYLPQNIQKAFYQAHPEMVRPNLDAKFTGTYNGKPLNVSYSQIIEAADKYQMAPLDYMKSLNLSPINPTPQSPPQIQQAAPQPTQQIQQSTPQLQNIPRGIRNNNPGNIVKTPQAWNGEIQGNDNKFKTFASPQAGINAVGTLLNKYYAQGKNTIADIIRTYAPPSENNTIGYIRDVAKKLNVNPLQKLNLSDPMVKGALVKAIIEHENGHVPYSDNTILGSI